EVRAVTSHNPGERWKPKKFFKELFWTAIFAGAGAVLCGLPFHFLPYLLASAYRSIYARAGIHYAISSPCAGWFAVAVAMVVRFITILPAIRYRDLPRLTADAPAKRAEAPEVSSVEKSYPVAPEKVSVS